MFDINELTLGQIKEISGLINGSKEKVSVGLSSMIGRKVIVRTYSAGVWFGTLSQKDGAEVILTNARCMREWWAEQGIGLSAVSVHGIKSKSVITDTVECVWLESIQTLPCSDEAIKSIEGAKNAKAG